MIGRASKPRGAAIVIAVVTTSITIIAGLLMTVLDHDGFPTLGSGLWWAVQTVTTVGYGDHVPTTRLGQLVAAAVMLLGIGFVTVITASITSVFVSQRRRSESLPGRRDRERRAVAGDHRAPRADRDDRSRPTPSATPSRFPQRAFENRCTAPTSSIVFSSIVAGSPAAIAFATQCVT